MIAEVEQKSVAKTQTLNNIFVCMANVPLYGTLGGRLMTTAFMLATMTVTYLFVWLFFFDRHGFHLLRWLSDLWPWRSDNFRSIESKGTGLFLICAPLPLVFWWRIGLRCKHMIGMPTPRANDRIWSFVLFFSIVFAGPLLSKMVNSTLAVIFTTALICVFWKYKRRSVFI
jgi:hypothetical protein